MNRPAALSLQRRESSGRVPIMKGCLKSPMPSPGLPTSCSARKTVAFGQEGTEEVYFADVWDRTPAEPARKLTYQDLLELKEVQRSLPRANQLDDPFSGKPASQFLRTVPIGLLPLLPETGIVSPPTETTSPVASPPPTPLGLSHQPWVPPNSSLPQMPPTQSSWTPPHLAHLLPKKPPPQRQKPTFAFLPLLETPPSSEASSPYTSLPSSRSPSPDRDIHSDTDHSHDPPTPSLTNASLDSSPLSRASSASPEPSFLQLPPLHEKERHHDYNDRRHVPDRYVESTEPLRLGRAPLNLARQRSPSPPGPSKTTAWHAFPDRTKKRPTSVSPQRSDASDDTDPPRHRNVMILNGIEIDLDDEEDDTGPTPSTSGPSSCSAAISSLWRPPIPQSPAATPMSSPSNRGKERQHSALPTLSCSPTISPSSPKKCPKSLCSPVRFQRDKSKVGSQGRASP